MWGRGGGCSQSVGGGSLEERIRKRERGSERERVSLT